jgi:hypothetical protein
MLLPGARAVLDRYAVILEKARFGESEPTEEEFVEGVKLASILSVLLFCVLVSAPICLIRSFGG